MHLSCDTPAWKGDYAPSNLNRENLEELSDER